MARCMRRLRKQARLTQAELAEVMTEAGFRWNRLTVAEVERLLDDRTDTRGRRLVLEEVFALAALFGVPVVEFLIPTDYLDLPLGQLPPDVARELVTGEGGVVGAGGPLWIAALTAAGHIRSRPASRLTDNTGR
jgi:transcriptional regulator with XRE-family HTH domain